MQEVNAPTVTYTITGLDAATTYRVKVSALNIHGEGPLGDSVEPTTNNVPSQVDPPTTVVSPANAKAARISWNEPEDNGSSISGYTVKIFDGSDYTEFSSDCTVTQGTPTTVWYCDITFVALDTTVGLDGGDFIKAVVIATNGEGDST